MRSIISNLGLESLDLQGLKKVTANMTTLNGLHYVAIGIYRAQGYRWEVRRSGELKIGYWRKILRPKNQRSPYPKRFVLIPGFGDTPLSWHSVVTLLQPVLKRNFDEIILFDLPGFGGLLSKERAFPSVDLLMSGVADTLDYLKPHTLFGHSLGGWLSAYYAALCGNQERPLANRLNYSGPESLMVVNPSGIYPDEPSMREFEAIIKGSLGLLPDSDEKGFSVLRPHLFANEPKWFKWIASHFEQFLAREDIAGFVGSAREELHVLDKLAKEIKAKTWVIWGEHDTLVPVKCVPAWLESLSNENNNARGVVIKKAGHSPHLETPFATAAIVGQIVSGKVPHEMGKRWWAVMKNTEPQFVRSN